MDVGAGASSSHKKEEVLQPNPRLCHHKLGNATILEASTVTCSLSLHTPPCVPGTAHDPWRKKLVLYPWETHTGNEMNILLNWSMNSQNLFFCSSLFYKHQSKLSPVDTTSSPQAWTCLLIFTLCSLHRSVQISLSSSRIKLKQVAVLCQPEEFR